MDLKDGFGDCAITALFLNVLTNCKGLGAVVRSRFGSGIGLKTKVILFIISVRENENEDLSLKAISSCTVL